MNSISTSLDSVTAQYVDVRLDRKKAVLDAYHNAVHPNEIHDIADKKDRKKNRDLER